MAKSRRLSAYNLHMKSKMRAGASFMSAVRSWRGGRKTKVSGGDTMARRRRGRRSVRARAYGGRRGRRSGGMRGGIGSVANMLQTAGYSYATGLGTKALIENLSDRTGFQMVKPFAGYLGAYTAFKQGGTIPGGVAGLAMILGNSTSSSSSGGNVTVL